MFTSEKLCKLLKKIVEKQADNEKVRIKYSDNPTKWVNSETELYASLDELQIISTEPEVIPEFLKRKGHQTLLSLVVHENSDISARALLLLSEITKVDDEEDDESEQKLKELLLEEMLKIELLQTLLSNLERLDVNIKDEANAITNTLTIINNIIELDNENLNDTQSVSLVNWLLINLDKALGYNTVKLSIIELLSILLCDSTRSYLDKSQEKVTKLEDGLIDGMEILLRQIACYTQKVPEQSEEFEYLDQVVDCLCGALMFLDSHKERFLVNEGPALVEMIIRDKSEVVQGTNLKLGSLKVLDSALITTQYSHKTIEGCCESFIESGGLRGLFPIFVNPKLAISKTLRSVCGKHKKICPKNTKHDQKYVEYEITIVEVEDHTISIILSLLKFSRNEQHIHRVLLKFLENNFEKTKRLLRLHQKYYNLAYNYSSEINLQNDAEREETINRRTMTLRQVDYVLLLVCYLCNEFELYALDTGEIFTVRFKELLAEISHSSQNDFDKNLSLSQQINEELSLYRQEVEGSVEQRSIDLLIKYFKDLNSLD